MRTVELMIAGRGTFEIEVGPTTTLKELAEAEGLAAYDFTVDNQQVDRSAWDRVNLFNARELFASQGVKGA